MSLKSNKGQDFGPQGNTFEGICNTALQLHGSNDDADIEKSFELCRLLLSYAELGDHHKGICHALLGTSDDEYLWHAEQAVITWTDMYQVKPGSSFSGDYTPTGLEIAYQTEWLKYSKEVLEDAQNDHNAIEEDYKRTTEEFVAEMGRAPTIEELVAADWEEHGEATDDDSEEDAPLAKIDLEMTKGNLAVDNPTNIDIKLEKDISKGQGGSLAATYKENDITSQGQDKGHSREQVTKVNDKERSKTMKELFREFDAE